MASEQKRDGRAGRRKRLDLHWQILIGLALGMIVGLAVNVLWNAYTWGALGVGDPARYRDGRDAALAETLPKDAGPAIGWLADSAGSYSAAPGSGPIEAPNNAYSARVVEFLTRELRAAEADMDQAAAAQAWLTAEAEALRDQHDATPREVAPIAPPVDPALAAGVAWITSSLAVEDPNATAGFAASVPRFIYKLNDFIGDIFLNCLRFIAVPIVLFSLVVGTSSLNDTAKLGRIGGKTIGIYLATTALAITVGLVLANVVKPGTFMNDSSREMLLAESQQTAADKIGAAEANRPADMWETMKNIVPTNPFEAIASGSMLQIVFFALAVGIALTLIPKDKARPVIAFADGMTEVIIKLVHILMKLAPFAVFALIAGVMADLGLAVLQSLVVYGATVIGGLVVMMFGVYPLALRLFGKVGYKRFFGAIAPAQLLAFSSSSSSATLPVTMASCEKRLGASEEVTSFVLPVGATINMDGTALYQAVAAVFIAQLYGIPLTLADQLTIVLTATLASIGTAGVPGVGMLMLVIVLQQLGFSAEVIGGGIAIIFGLDRLLDMCRTTCNVTGDCAVCGIIASSERALLTEDEVSQRRAQAEAAGLDEHPHEGTGQEFDVEVGSTTRPVDVPDKPGHRKGDS